MYLQRIKSLRPRLGVIYVALAIISIWFFYPRMSAFIDDMRTPKPRPPVTVQQTPSVERHPHRHRVRPYGHSGDIDPDLLKLMLVCGTAALTIVGVARALRR